MMRIHDSKSRSKRYSENYKHSGKPHIFISVFSGLFTVYADNGVVSSINAASDFSDKLNVARAKS